ncbi:hypothetical protein CHS0354_012110 [Potamilus streckersoni]|uniref:UDENN domain-containing protein n=1 Tax=Potamilus streckersoni TaxID=2493646 RepID=A0AAE0VT03_9BIVA|nr:hypothetical protein CHS0354_012110 [Potamilus streckersoni]
MANVSKGQDNPVLHVVVIGFHHKKGCQVEYSYPPLIEGGLVDSNDVPPEWRHLASLALPDGAHNYMQDTIYFHLPSRFTCHRTVYGVACYRQMDAKDLVNKTDDVTRSTVQKSVCVLSNLPLYGLIQAKLELITHAYFDECDFTKVELLEEMYKNLNLSLKQSLLDGGSHVFLGMSARDVVTSFKHRILLLFKLILLERKVLFTGGPVKKIVNTLLSVLSLFPGMIEFGLTEAAMYNVNKVISPTLNTTSFGQGDAEEFLEIRYSHFGNSEENTPEVNLKLKTSTACNNSIEPESPTMERGYELQDDNSIKKNQKVLGSDTTVNSLGMESSNTCNADKALKKMKDSVNESLKRSQTLEDSSLDSGQCEPLVFKEDHFVEDSEINQAVCWNVMVAENNMKMDMKSMVQLQVGKNIPNNGCVVNIEEYSKDKEEFSGSLSERATVGSTRADLSLSFNDTLGDSVRHSDSVEELDTPESLNQIDKEDCFSWEEDRLHLFIDHEIDGQERERNPKEEVSLVSSFKDDSILERNTKRSHGSTGSQSDGKDMDSAMATVGSKDGSTRESSPVSVGSTSSEKSSPAAAIKNRLSSAFSGISIRQKLKSKVGSKDETSQPASPDNDSSVMPVQDDLGFPLAIFAKGSICHPYLSLQYFDLLSDINVRSFVIGATNILFKQKRHLTDVFIDVSDSKIEIHDRELQKQLHLTTADLRFADILIKAVIEDNDIFLDGTEWEGGDEWLRVQFRMYLQSLLATMLQDDAKLVEDFGVHFIQAWKTTHNYRYWKGSEHLGMKDVPCGHPCQGNLGVADIRVRLTH